jgi:hypothetical protein
MFARLWCICPGFEPRANEAMDSRGMLHEPEERRHGVKLPDERRRPTPQGAVGGWSSTSASWAPQPGEIQPPSSTNAASPRFCSARTGEAAASCLALSLDGDEKMSTCLDTNWNQ